jgi:hypothetical protein
MKLLSEFATQDDEGLKASLYLDRPHMKPDLAKKISAS